MSRRNALRLALAGAALAFVPTAADASVIFGTTINNDLVAFDSSTPGTLLGSVGVSGLLGVNERILGIDFRPATGQLYAVGSANNIYTINTVTGQATLASTFSVGINGGRFGVDFNPVPDRLRTVSDAEQNLRTNVDTGAVTVDNPLNPGDPNIVGAAYANNVAGVLTTTLFTIDSNSDVLNVQNPPNNGTQVPRGPLGVDTSGFVGFDIETVGGVDTAYASLHVGRASSLYLINLLTGQATLVGQIGGGNGLILDGLAVAPTGAGIPGGGVPGIPLPPALLMAVAPALVALRKSRRR